LTHVLLFLFAAKQIDDGGALYTISWHHRYTLNSSETKTIKQP